ncbi:hypothetical protein IE983_06950 [Enterobacter hormaechei]|uniref:Uncharacterized protein n=1 Tax=Enterobacter hormaechei TaxID=158836 RepID=A0A927DHP2_9ENTR|nr:hypothetical protein [Enterobacter hormaechei]
MYALVVYFTLCKLLSRWKLPMLGILALASIAINFLPLPLWGNEQRGAQHDLLQPRRMVRRAVDGVDERDEFAPQLAGTYRLWRGVGSAVVR